MNKVKFTIFTFIEASPETVYNAWLNGREHANMTGGEAVSAPREGGEFSAWDGYIYGKHITLVPNEKIVQSWRTSEFDDSDKDSRLEILLKRVDNGCEITLIHSDIPVGQPDYEKGWEEHYFKPMRGYFGKASKS